MPWLLVALNHTFFTHITHPRFHVRRKNINQHGKPCKNAIPLLKHNTILVCLYLNPCLGHKHFLSKRPVCRAILTLSVDTTLQHFFTKCLVSYLSTPFPAFLVDLLFFNLWCFVTKWGNVAYFLVAFMSYRYGVVACGIQIQLWRTNTPLICRRNKMVNVCKQYVAFLIYLTCFHLIFYCC